MTSSIYSVVKKIFIPPAERWAVLMKRAGSTLLFRISVTDEEEGWREEEDVGCVVWVEIVVLEGDGVCPE